MPFRYVRQLFVEGMNEDMDPAAIDLGTEQSATITKISSATNMVFERGLAVTRPPLTLATITALPAGTSVTACASLPLAFNLTTAGISILLLGRVGGTTSLYHASSVAPLGSAAVAITGAAPGVPVGQSLVPAIVNQVVLIPGFPNGLLRWDPAGNVYTIIATPWRYVAKLFARAIGAYSMAGTPTDAITVGASASGDETTWIGPTAYTSILSDIPDEITGLGVIKGTVVLPRRFGFHLGSATGQSPAIFSWAAYTDNAIGCIPDTFQIFNNVAYFISEVGIHAFDLVNITDIGEGVYTDISSLIQSKTSTVVTFIGYAYRQDYQPTYNIVFNNAGGAVGTVIHFMYNIREGKWSKHSYVVNAESPAIAGGMALHIWDGSASQKASVPAIGLMVWNLAGATTATLAVIKGSNGISDEGQIDASVSFVGPAITLQPSYVDTFLTRIMVVLRFPHNVAVAGLISVSVTAMLDNVSVTQTFTSATSPVMIQPGWNNIWFNGRLAGQHFQATVNLQQTYSPTKVKEMYYEFTTSGKERA